MTGPAPGPTDDRLDLVVIGLGSAGRSAAELAADLGARVAAVERARPGGDCLWAGCVPSKAVVASARVAHQVRHAGAHGVVVGEPAVDLAAVWARMHAVRDAVAETDDDPGRLRAAGIDVHLGHARLVAPGVVEVGDGTSGGRTLHADHVLVATGSRPAVPDVPGLAELAPLTTEALFDADAPPPSLVVLGGGPVGVELSQALVRLGVPVTLLEREPSLLPGEEPALAARVGRALAADGIVVVTGARVSDARRDPGGDVVLAGTTPSGPATWRAADVLLAAGRVPVTDGLGLDELGVALDGGRPVVDALGRTSVPGVWAAGDVAGPHHLTHWAATAGTTAVRAALLGATGGEVGAVPWCTFSDPELARVGATTAQARALHGDDVETWTIDLAEVDRARAEGAAGAVVLVTGPRQRLLGAHVLAPAAGEVIGELALAIHDGRRLNHLAAVLHAYPTISSAIGTLAARAVRAKASRVGAARLARRRR